LNTSIPLEKRQSLFESMQNTIEIAHQKKDQYQKLLPSANEYLKSFIKAMDQIQTKLEKYEETRCEQIHSSIN